MRHTKSACVGTNFTRKVFLFTPSLPHLLACSSQLLPVLEQCSSEQHGFRTVSRQMHTPVTRSYTGSAATHWLHWGVWPYRLEVASTISLIPGFGVNSRLDSRWQLPSSLVAPSHYLSSLVAGARWPLVLLAGLGCWSLVLAGLGCWYLLATVARHRLRSPRKLSSPRPCRAARCDLGPCRIAWSTRRIGSLTHKSWLWLGPYADWQPVIGPSSV